MENAEWKTHVDSARSSFNIQHSRDEHSAFQSSPILHFNMRNHSGAASDCRSCRRRRYVVGGAVRDCAEFRSCRRRSRVRRCTGAARAGSAVHITTLGYHLPLRTGSSTACTSTISRRCSMAGTDRDSGLARLHHQRHGRGTGWKGALLDPFDGRGDLERRVVRMVDATNFDDDPCFRLKAVRAWWRSASNSTSTTPPWPPFGSAPLPL